MEKTQFSFKFLFCYHVINKKAQKKTEQNQGVGDKTTGWEIVVTGEILNTKRQSTSEFNICGVLRDLVPFVQFKKPEKHPWSCETFPIT